MSRTRGSRVVASVGLSLAIVVTLAFVPVTMANGSTGRGGALVTGGPAGDEMITFASLATCDVFDALTIMKNKGSKAIRILRVSAIIPSEGSPARDQISYQLRSFARGSTTGAAGAVENMPVLGGHVLGPVVGATLRPVATSSLWYVVAVRMRVNQPRGSEWMIRGLRLEYAVGARSFTATFHQEIRLPHTDC